jgi:NAD(P)-dependent dehydrogenase (short-subunit alcohol dehydrogenase family)
LPDRARPHEGRVALVTGAAGGIGQAIALGLARQGATVVAADISDLADTAARLAELGRAHRAETLDVADPGRIEAVRAAVAVDLGRCDILVNNAAILEAVRWDALDHDLWRRVMTVNVDGPMLMCKAFLPLVRAGGWGRIVNLSSGSVMVSMPTSIAYRTSKMAVVGFTRALAAEVGVDGVTVNAVCPSITDTAMGRQLPEEAIAGAVRGQAIPRLAQPDDIAGSVLALVSDEAGWITGQTVLANGGGSFL